jgi:hypothetical protein
VERRGINKLQVDETVYGWRQRVNRLLQVGVLAQP